MSKGGRLSRLIPKFFRGESKPSSKSGSNGSDFKGPACLVIFLDDSEQRVPYKGSWKGQALFDAVCEMINLLEKDYFGLRYVDDTGQTHWLDHAKSVSSQLKGCSTPHKFYFGVKFYAADPCKLHEEITRYLFFLQVKRDILQGRLPVSFEEVAELCAYAVQSELGDFEPRIHTVGYVSEFCFVPNQTEELEARIAAVHRRCVGATPVMAEQRYLEKVKWLEMYGVDLHPVQGESNVEYFLGLTPTGIVVYKQKTKVASYFWPRITKSSNKGKIFTIKVKDKNNEEHAYAFELSTKQACKHLWKCCVEHHMFFSGRSERLAANESRARKQPNVQRSQSRRQPRRANSDSRLAAEQLYQDQYTQNNRSVVTVMGQPEPVRAPRHRSLPELHGRQSPRSVKSAPWESKFDRGLYTSGHDSPSVYSERKDGKHPSFISGSDSESGISQRKRYFPNRKGSDNESDASATRRRRRELDSDSGSEVSFSNSAGNRKKRNTQSEKGAKQSNGHLLYPFHDKENAHGSVPSLHSAPAGELKQRRRRRRSKSPGNTKRPPEELKQHIEFDLVDTEGMTVDQLRDIPYTKVETKANLFRVKYSPKIRQKIWASRTKSFGDADKSGTQKSGASSTISRQDSYYTDPSGRYVYGSRISGSLSQGRLAGGQEVTKSQLLDQSSAPSAPVNPSLRSEKNDGYSSSASRSRPPPPYSSLKDTMRGGGQSDYEHYQSDTHQQDRYRQGRSNQSRLSYHEQASDYNSHAADAKRYSQNVTESDRYSQNNSEYGRSRQRGPDSNRYSQYQSDTDSRYSRSQNPPAGARSYEPGSGQNTSSSARPNDSTRVSYGRPGQRPEQNSDAGSYSRNNQGPDSYNTSARNSQGPTSNYGTTSRNSQGPPDNYGTSSRNPQGPASSYSPYARSQAPRGQSYPIKDSSFTAGSRDSQTHTPSPRYNESLVDGASSVNSASPRGNNKSAFDQRSTPPRANAQYYEDKGLPQVSYSGQSGSSSGYSGSTNRQSGSSNVSPLEQHRMRNTLSGYSPQYVDRQQSQALRQVQGPHSTKTDPGRHGYTQHTGNNYRSDLVTQL
ncbi:band 4.1-like protein 4A [Physella acuta]|uniref:band 4.1-like protein 4A n=1 Tax=Physella acuta TaxID=109671 RepID=UPI0027DDE6E5|nr:band 4.1-like protein 4A [Physella acuta]